MRWMTSAPLSSPMALECLLHQTTSSDQVRATSVQTPHFSVHHPALIARNWYLMVSKDGPNCLVISPQVRGPCLLCVQPFSLTRGATMSRWWWGAQEEQRSPRQLPRYIRLQCPFIAVWKYSNNFFAFYQVVVCDWIVGCSFCRWFSTHCSLTTTWRKLWRIPESTTSWVQTPHWESPDLTRWVRWLNSHTLQCIKRSVTMSMLSLQKVMAGLALKNHETEFLTATGAVVQAVVRWGDRLHAESDPRKGGYAAGYWDQPQNPAPTNWGKPQTSAPTDRLADWTSDSDESHLYNRGVTIPVSQYSFHGKNEYMKQISLWSFKNLLYCM